jgi:hypothetical protein
MALSKGVNYSMQNKQTRKACRKKGLLLPEKVSYLDCHLGRDMEDTLKISFVSRCVSQGGVLKFIFHLKNIKTSFYTVHKNLHTTFLLKLFYYKSELQGIKEV